MDGHKKGFSLLSSALLVMVPWMQISKAVTGGTYVGLTDLAVVTAAGLALHGVYLAFNTTASRALKLGGKHGGREGELINICLWILSNAFIKAAGSCGFACRIACRTSDLRNFPLIHGLILWHADQSPLSRSWSTAVEFCNMRYPGADRSQTGLPVTCLPCACLHMAQLSPGL